MSYAWLNEKLPATIFEAGGIDATGNKAPYLYNQRARTKNIVRFPYDIIVTAGEDAKIGCAYYSEDGVFQKLDDWAIEQTILKDSYVRIVVSVTTDKPPGEIVDLLTCVPSKDVYDQYVQPLYSGIEFICRDGRVTSDYPPDSYYAIRDTANNEYDRIRFSVMVTTDNEYVCVHDTTINNLAVNKDGTAITQSITTRDCSLAELNSYDWGLKFGEKYKGMQVPMLSDCLRYANMFGLPVSLDFKWTLRDEDIDPIYNLLVKYNALNALMVQITIPRMQEFAQKSKFLSYYFSGNTTQINSQAGSLKPLMSGYNRIYVQPSGTETQAPTDEQIEAVCKNNFTMIVTPIEGFDALIGSDRGFDKAISAYECHYIPKIKTTLRKYMNRLFV
jgi:hypothetical protein